MMWKRDSTFNKSFNRTSSWTLSRAQSQEIALAPGRGRGSSCLGGIAAILFFLLLCVCVMFKLLVVFKFYLLAFSIVYW